MKSIIRSMGRLPAILIFLSALVILSACQGGSVSSTGSVPSADQALPVKSGPAAGEVIGTGQTRVALLLPLSAPGNGSTIAAEYRNAAQLAMDTRGLDVMELVIKDTGGSAAGAIAKTQEAVLEGAAIILGPVFSGSVTSAASVARPKKRIMVAFSSDPSAASNGVFLMSFLPNQIVDRTVSYATGTGLTSIAAILPQGAYGALVERQLRQTLAERGGILTGVSRYEYNNESVVAAVQQLLPAIEQSDAVFIPDGGTAPIAIARVMQSEGIKLSEKRLIGTGQWRSSDLSSPFLQGAVFADMDQSGFEAFKLQYKEKFEAEPTVNAGLGYDAVGLVADLISSGDPRALSRAGLEKPSGFRGVTGIFRFMKDGETQRGLAVYQVQEGDVVVADPAPQHFFGLQSAQY
jgi:ABC-type branched-subunit amino acid transport system substrate-binding protein